MAISTSPPTPHTRSALCGPQQRPRPACGHGGHKLSGIQSSVLQLPHERFNRVRPHGGPIGTAAVSSGLLWVPSCCLCSSSVTPWWRKHVTEQAGVCQVPVRTCTHAHAAPVPHSDTHTPPAEWPRRGSTTACLGAWCCSCPSSTDTAERTAAAAADAAAAAAWQMVSAAAADRCSAGSAAGPPLVRKPSCAGGWSAWNSGLSQVKLQRPFRRAQLAAAAGQSATTCACCCG